MLDGLTSVEFCQLKQKELLYYFGLYYSKEELYDFFYSILSTDIAFSRLIYKNLEKIHNIEEFATLMNYSISGFKKRFHKVFGMPAYRWLSHERANKIFHAITCSRETFTQISYDFGFSSPSHLNNFCKKMFGATPGEIRAQKEVVPVDKNTNS
jgi:AraC-like DNA-binding protein